MTPESPWHARYGLSWSTRTVPTVLMLLLGAAVGPAGLALFTPLLLSMLDPVTPVAVTALGMLAGLELTRPMPPRRWSVLAKASLQALVTGAVVAGGTLQIAPALLGLDGSDAWRVALVIGVAASMSASLPAIYADGLQSLSSRVRDLDAPVPALVGAVVLASLHTQSSTASLVLVAQTTALALAISATAWLLLSRGVPGAEQRVFTVAILLLTGGIADALSLSALAIGLLAGLFLGVIGGVTRDCIERDIGYVRHPLVVLMLLMAGARITLAWPILALASAYFVLRVAGKLAGGWLARRTPGVTMPAGLGASLLSPGVLGLAFAVNAAPLLGASAPAILTATALGTIASQVAAGLWHSGARVT